MTQSIRIRARLRGDLVDAHVLMPHAMETGLRLDASGQRVPAHYITEVTATLGTRTVFSARMSFAMSSDPLLTFRFRGASVGERLRVAWTDSRGETRVDEALIT